jgi:hypothetical protein
MGYYDHGTASSLYLKDHRFNPTYQVHIRLTSRESESKSILFSFLNLKIVGTFILSGNLSDISGYDNPSHVP